MTLDNAHSLSTPSGTNKDICIILSHPQMGENIGAAARVMKNFGLNDLRIVSPRDRWPNKKAENMSAGGVDVIQKAKIYHTLEEAISDRQFVFATAAASRDMNKDHIFSYEIDKTLASIDRLGILFGRESSGLSNQEISLCNKIITINTESEYSSLNLAQAICIICYELYKVPDLLGSDLKTSAVNLASKGEMEIFLKHLFSSLDSRGFFKSQDRKDKMTMKLRGIFNRMDGISPKELNALHGIVSILEDK